MTLQLPDSIVDAIKIEIAPLDSSDCINVIIDDSFPEDAIAIKYYLESVDFFHLDLCAIGVQNQTGGFGNDTAIMDYSRSDEAFFPGVRFAALFGWYEPTAEVVISREACDRLMTRFFDLMIQIAEQHQLSILQHPNWQEFLAAAAQVKQRAMLT